MTKLDKTFYGEHIAPPPPEETGDSSDSYA